MTGEDDKRISIFIVEDSPIYREALEGNLRAQEDLFEVTGWADRQEQALLMVEQRPPDIVLLDLMLSRDRRAGIEIIQEMRRSSPTTQVVVLTAFLDDDLIFEAIRAGAVTYLLKDSISGDKLADILQRVRDGEPPVDPDIARRLYGLFQASGENPDQANAAPLTEREQEVLRLVADGLSNKEIASLLVISVKTVKTHVSNILSKLNLNNRTELRWWYQNRGNRTGGNRNKA